MKLKRQILDALDKAHDFALPADAGRRRVRGDLGAGDARACESDRQDASPTRARARRSCAPSIARSPSGACGSGSSIGEIGEKTKLQVTQDELRRALIEQARRYPGQEKFVYEYYEKNPAALIELRAPIFEDKVIDHIVEQAKPAEKKVTVEELLKPIEGRRRSCASARPCAWS